MRRRQGWPLAALLMLALLSGCRSDPHQALLERELRLHEDQIYYLQDVIAGFEQRLDSCRRENDSLRRELGIHDGDPHFPRPTFPERPFPDRETIPPVDRPDVGPLRPPAVELGPPTGPPSIRHRLPPESLPESLPEELPEAFQQDVEPRPLPMDQDGFEETSLRGPMFLAPGDDPLHTDDVERIAPIPGTRALTPESVQPRAPQPADRMELEDWDPDETRDDRPPRFTSNAPRPPLPGEGGVQRLVINRLITGQTEVNGRRGDEGLMAIVETRDAQGRLLDAPGPMRLTVVDPAQPVRTSRVARWEFTSDETAARFRDGALGRGVHFELPWPNRTPQASRLKLLVEYLAADGRVLTAEHEFRMRPRGGDEWMPATRREPEPPAVAIPRVQLAEPKVRPPDPVSPVPVSPVPARSTEAPRGPEWSPYR